MPKSMRVYLKYNGPKRAWKTTEYLSDVMSFHRFSSKSFVIVICETPNHFFQTSNLFRGGDLLGPRSKMERKNQETKLSGQPTNTGNGHKVM